MNILESLIDCFISALIILVCIASFLLQTSLHKNKPLYIDSEFSEYFEEFDSDSKKYKVVPYYSNLTTTFVNDIDNSILAYCIPKLNIVKVSRKKWNELDIESRKLLLYHEWGHCALRREHVTDDTSFNTLYLCPSSIMHPYINPVRSCYQQGKSWYDKELFTNPNKKEIIP